MGWYPLVAGLAAFAAVCLIGAGDGLLPGRLEGMVTADGDLGRKSGAPGFLASGAGPKVLGGDGLLSLIEEAKAHVRAGGSLEEAFSAHLAGMALSSTPTMPDFRQLRVLLLSRLGPGQSPVQAERVAVELDLALRVSRLLGCEASGCLDAVIASYKRAQMLVALREKAFSVPKATVKLLSALPLATVGLGELMGARPLKFLLLSTPGRLCLALGFFAYAAGMAWMRMLLRRVEQADSGFYVHTALSPGASS